jgi:hypothetical protein
LPEPGRVDILDLSSNRDVHAERRTRCVLFPISIPSWGVAAYRVRYVQPTPMKLMEYLLTTGRAWGRPLEHAAFSIRVPDSLQMTFLSFPKDTLWKSDGGTTYVIHRQQFLPDRELTIRWQRKHP